MSILRSVDATMKEFWVDIDGKPVLLDHIKQLNLYTSIGCISEPGDITITYDMYKMLSEESQRFSPVNKFIEFEIIDDKSGTRQYVGKITNFRKIHNVKQDLVIMSFDREPFLKLMNVRWWKCFKEKTILEIFKEFLEEHGIPLNRYPDNHEQLRGTFWEYFAIPQNTPTLDFLIAELSKDNFVVYNNPETQGVTVCSYDDMNRLDQLHKNNPDYVVDEVLAKFDQSKDHWIDTTFVNGKQIDTRAPWKIMEWTSQVVPSLQQDVKHKCIYYSALKKPLEFKFDESKLLPNDINLQKVDELSGKQLRQAKIQPYPASEALRDNLDTPKVDTTGYDGYTSQTIYPRYMYYRMRESYATGIKWVESSMMVAGSCKAVVPMTTVMVTYFENAMNRDKDLPAQGDIWQSGLYLITACQTIITGNNILNKYNLAKPYL